MEGMEAPHSLEAEHALLGAILANNDAYQVVAELIEPGDFFERIHADIYDISAKLIGSGKLASPITLLTFLPKQAFEGMTMAQYVAHIAAEATTVINAKDYAFTIRELSDRRKMQVIGETIRQPPASDQADAVAGWAVDELDRIVARRSATSAPALTMQDAMVRALEAASHAYQQDGQIGLKTRLRDLDSKLGGMQKGDLVILAGRPGMGKTAAALTMARNMGEDDEPGIFFSLEMADVPLSHRMIADTLYNSTPRGQKPLYYNLLRTGRFRADDFDRIVEAGRWLERLPIKIETQPGLTVSQIAARARQAKRRGKLSWIMIDYLGLMKGSGIENRSQEIGQITYALKNLAKELGIVVFLMSQLSRGVESREDKRPTLADLRESGNIEQDADTVIFLYREEYYLVGREPPTHHDQRAAWEAKMLQAHNKLLMMVAKQRSGPTGNIEVMCEIGANAVRDLARDLPAENVNESAAAQLADERQGAMPV